MDYYVSSGGGFETGGLGNHLFFFAIAIEYGYKFNKKPIFFNRNINECNYHGVFLNKGFTDFFNNKLTTIDYNIINKYNFIKLIDIGKYEELIDYPNNNVFIDGYRQSWKYFTDYTRNYMNELVYSNPKFVKS